MESPEIRHDAGTDRLTDFAPNPIGDLLDSGPDESLFRAHFESLPGAAYIWRRAGADFVIVARNKAARERVRTTALEFVIGASAAQLQGDQLDFVSLLDRCARAGRSERVETDYRYQSGLVRRLSVTLIPIAPDHVVHHTEDVTDRHEAEQALRASEARARALMEAHPDTLLCVSRDGVYLDAHISERVQRELPIRKENYIGRRVEEVFEPEFAEIHGRCRRKALDTGVVQTWDFTRVIDGQRRYVQARFVRCGADEVLVTVTDVTDRVDVEREILQSIERERSMIGHDLHDGLGQLLTGVKLMLEPLRKKWPAQTGRDGANLQQAVDLINQSIAQTSELARGLSPMPWEAGLPLCSALAQLTERSRAFGLACRIEVVPELDRLDEEASSNLFRIAQEAMTNSIKHGCASELHVHCRSEANGVTLLIEDDGVGFDAEQPRGGGMGLHIMRYRARVLGGAMKFSNRPGGGAVVECFCPFPQHNRARISRSSPAV